MAGTIESIFIRRERNPVHLPGRGGPSLRGGAARLVPRETPLSLMAIENMRKVRLAGGIILPPMVGYYAAPQTIDDVTNFFVGKILDVLGIGHQLYRRWMESK